MDDRQNAALDKLLAEARPDIAAHWASCREAGIEASNSEATGKVNACIADFFENLKALPAEASDDAILAQMKALYSALDDINATADHGLLETDERELLVPLFIDAVAIAGVDPDKYDGEPGGEWHEF